MSICGDPEERANITKVIHLSNNLTNYKPLPPCGSCQGRSIGVYPAGMHQ